MAVESGLLRSCRRAESALGEDEAWARTPFASTGAERKRKESRTMRRERTLLVIRGAKLLRHLVGELLR